MHVCTHTYIFFIYIYKKKNTYISFLGIYFHISKYQPYANWPSRIISCSQENVVLGLWPRRSLSMCTGKPPRRQAPRLLVLSPFMPGM